jgi:hypothetical protein
MRWLLVLLLLAGCQDHYRYKCQNPDHFQDLECQRPKCLFTQQCSDYLVAPVLEKQVVQQQTQPPSDK